MAQNNSPPFDKPFDRLRMPLRTSPGRGQGWVSQVADEGMTRSGFPGVV